MKQMSDSIMLVLFTIILVAGAGLIIAFRKRLTKRIVYLIAIITVAVAVLAVGVALLALDSSFEREYLDDLRITLSENDGAIIIKEWTFLQGGGAEIYYENEGEEILIGTTSADDGYCPFKNGQYTITEEDGKITVSWAFFSSKDAKKDWWTKTFSLN